VGIADPLPEPWKNFLKSPASGGKEQAMTPKPASKTDQRIVWPQLSGSKKMISYGCPARQEPNHAIGYATGDFLLTQRFDGVLFGVISVIIPHAD
jgi:hypothetical protein